MHLKCKKLSWPCWSVIKTVVYRVKRVQLRYLAIKMEKKKRNLKVGFFYNFEHSSIAIPFYLISIPLCAFIKTDMQISKLPTIWLRNKRHNCENNCLITFMIKVGHNWVKHSLWIKVHILIQCRSLKSMDKLLFILIVCLYVGGAVAKTGEIFICHRLIWNQYFYENYSLLELKGVLLTPTEGCGHTKVAHKRIVGGSTAKPGAWPWMALVLYVVLFHNFEHSFIPIPFIFYFISIPWCAFIKTDM